MLKKKPGSAKKPKNKDEMAEKVKKMLTLIAKAVSKGMSYNDSARLAGLHPQTFYKWKGLAKQGKEPYAKYWQIMEQADLAGELDILERIELAGKNGDWRADAWMLEKRKPKRYGKREQINQTVIDKTKKDLFQMSDDELEAHVKKLEKLTKEESYED